MKDEDVLKLFDDPAKDMDRFSANMELLKLLGDYLKDNPHLRFNQALIALKIVRDETDDFYTEPQDVLARVKSALKNGDQL